MSRRAGPAAPPESAAGLALMGGEAVGADGSVARSWDAAGIERALGSPGGPDAGRAGPARPRTRGVSPTGGPAGRRTPSAVRAGADVAAGMAPADQRIAPIASAAMPSPSSPLGKLARTFTETEDRLSPIVISS